MPDGGRALSEPSRPLGVGLAVGPGLEVDLPGLDGPWDFARWVERAGFGWLVVRDAPGSVRLGADALPLEPMVLLGGFARRSERLPIGVLAAVPGRRPPALVVHALSTVDRFNGGRSVLVWTLDPTAADAGTLAEAVGASRALLDGPGPTTFAGRTIRLERAYLRPGPVRSDSVAVLVGVDDGGSAEPPGAPEAPLVPIRRVRPGDAPVAERRTVLLEPTGAFDAEGLLALARLSRAGPGPLRRRAPG